MTDQAAQLRKLVHKNGQRGESHRSASPLIVVGSGKGGVGKSVFALALAGAWAKQGKKVLLLDADLTTPAQHVLTAFDPPYGLSEVLKRGWEEKRADQLALTTNLYLLRGMRKDPGSRIYQQEDIQFFAEQLEKMSRLFDRIVIDTHSGANQWNLGLFQCASHVFLLTVSEPTSVIETYLLMKAVRSHVEAGNFSLVVNQSLSTQSALEAHQKLNLALNHFLHVQLPLALQIPYDETLRNALVEQEPFWQLEMEVPALRRIRDWAAQQKLFATEQSPAIHKTSEVLP